MLLTIDNTDGALPIEYAEVTISRTMFRSGGSEYAINGTPCRLLDVQELLSDSGIGREMHVIVGQGQLDTILHATPEDRRGFIEEAAGVLKHRKRKEKALRKLDSTDGNLTRLGDLLSEIRRQLKPLGRQAEVARRAAVVQADVRDARARLHGRRPRHRPHRAGAGAGGRDDPGRAPRGGRGRAWRRPARARDGSRARCARTSRRWPGPRRRGSGCPAMRERLRGTASLAAERVRNAAGSERREPSAELGRDPDELEAEAAAGPRAGVARSPPRSRPTAPRSSRP